jgi:hypothetical protein
MIKQPDIKNVHFATPPICISVLNRMTLGMAWQNKEGASFESKGRKTK